MASRREIRRAIIYAGYSEDEKGESEFERNANKKGVSINATRFRRTAITRALDMGESYRRVMNASRHKSITSIQRYDLHREALEENSILTLNYNDNAK